MYTVDDYKWNLNPRFIRIMSVDNTRVHYLSEKEAKRRKDKYIDGSNFNDLGVPIFGNEGNNK